MRVLGISGSLRAGSHNERLLRLVAEELPAGVELEIFDGLRELPPYDEDLEPERPASVVRLTDAIATADAVVIATPEYNGSVPGQLKNALDWVSRPLAANPLRSKPVAVIGAATGSFGGVWAQGELKKILGLMAARVLDVDLAVAKAHERLEEPDVELAAGVRAVADAVAGEPAAVVAAAA